MVCDVGQQIKVVDPRSLTGKVCKNTLGSNVCEPLGVLQFLLLADIGILVLRLCQLVLMREREAGQNRRLVF